MPQHRISVCLEPSENAKHSSKTSFCESLELESDQIEKLEDIFNSEDLSFLSRLEQLIREYKSIQKISAPMPSRCTQDIVDKYNENTPIEEESKSAIELEQKRLDLDAEILRIIDEPDSNSEIRLITGEIPVNKNPSQIEFNSEGEIVLSDYSLGSDSSDAEIEVIEDRLSERSDLKFDENTRNSISSETSSFEVIKTPRNDDIIPMNKPITTTLSPSKDKPASSTPRGSKEFPNLAVKFPIQQPELPKSCGWKQKKYIPSTSHSPDEKGESVPNLVSDESENEFETIKTVEKVPFYNKGNKNDQKKTKRESTRGIRGRKRNQMLRRANEHGTYIDSKGQEQKRK